MYTTCDLLCIFTDAYYDKLILNIKRPPPIRAHENGQKKVFNASEIRELISLLNRHPQEEDERSTTISIRYLVTKQKQLLLAREGEPNAYTPRHGQMAKKCLAAGNLFFNRTMTEAVAINHQSGDFEPPLSSLVFALQAILACQEITISPSFYLIINEFSNKKTDNTLFTMPPVLKGMIHNLNLMELEAAEAAEEKKTPPTVIEKTPEELEAEADSYIIDPDSPGYKTP